MAAKRDGRSQKNWVESRGQEGAKNSPMNGVETYSEGIWLPKDVILWAHYNVESFPMRELRGFPTGLALDPEPEGDKCLSKFQDYELNGVHGVSQGRWGWREDEEGTFLGREPDKSNLEFIVGVTRKVPELMQRTGGQGQFSGCEPLKNCLQAQRTNVWIPRWEGMRSWEIGIDSMYKTDNRWEHSVYNTGNSMHCGDLNRREIQGRGDMLHVQL